MNITQLSHRILLSTPKVTGDPLFEKSLVLIHESNEEGTMGVLLNKPLGLSVKKVLEKLEVQHPILEKNEQDTLIGGPVGQQHGIILYHKKRQASNLSPERSTYIHMLTEEVVKRPEIWFEDQEVWSFCLGFCIWGEDQIQKEIMNDYWIVVDIKLDQVLEQPAEARYAYVCKYLHADMDHFLSEGGRS